MRTKVLSLIWLLALSTFLLAQTPPEIASGQFDAELGICSHNGTVYLVYNTNTSADQTGSIVLMYRTSDGENWISKTVAQNIAGTTKPTISINDGEIIVSYMDLDGWESYTATSSNQGDSWQYYSMGRTFESSPYLEKVAGGYRGFTLSLPYPQHEQDNYLYSEDSDDIIAYHRYVCSGLDQDGDPIVFRAPELIEGNYRSDGDIWIHPINGAWPTFTGLVITSKQVKVYPDGGTDYPVETVFPGGLIENAPVNDARFYHRRDGIPIGPSGYDDKYIIFADVNGTSADLYLGIRTQPFVSRYLVYPVYPSQDLGEPLFTNIFAAPDTIWVTMGGVSYIPDDTVLFSQNELWIKGTFAGQQTWASASDIKIVGDILLAGTPPGEDPSNNTHDFVSLFSEKRIEIKYGYRGIVDSLRYHVCRANSDPIKIYASLNAVGLNDGCFTFEYQHPHPSVPAVNMYGSYWSNIDLHRYRYPQTESSPWPPTIDYPFYNPLWPEGMPYLERGTVQMWGPLSERYKGYLHRGYVDTDNPIWDIANNLYGSSSAPSVVNHVDPVLGIQLGSVNYPGTTGNGVGYQREHHRDIRRTIRNDFNWGFGFSIPSYDALDSENPAIPSYGHDDGMIVPQAIRSKVIARNGSAALYAVNGKLGLHNGQYLRGIYPFGPNDTAIIKQMEWVDDQRALILRYDAANPEPYSLHIINPYTPNYGEVIDVSTEIFGNQQDESRSLLLDILPSVDGTARFAVCSLDQSTTISLLEISNIDLQNGEYTLQRWGYLPWDNAWNRAKQHQLSLKNVTDDHCDVILNVYHTDDNLCSSIRYATINLYDPSSTEDPLVPAAKPSVSVYPNPSKADFSITLKNLQAGEVKAEIFNIRGQKVAEIKDFSSASGTELNGRWQALDANQQRMASGVYLMRIKQSGKVIATKRITVF